MPILDKNSKDFSQKDIQRGAPYNGTVPALSWTIEPKGSIGERINIPSAGYYIIKVQALAEASRGEWPRMALSLNANEVDARIVTERVANYTFVHKLSAGDHSISFAFTYDDSSPDNQEITPHMNIYPNGGLKLHTGRVQIMALESGIVRVVPSPQHPTIQSAINASSAGDKVVVKAGTYHEQLLVKNGVIIVSDESGDGNEKTDNPLDDRLTMPNGDQNVGKRQVLRRALRTIIDGAGFPDEDQANAMVKFAEGATEATILDGFSITNMPQANHMLPGHPHTVECRGASPCILNNIIYNNGSTGIGSYATFRDEHLSVQQRNFSYSNVTNPANPIIRHNVCFKNSGAGIGNNYYSAATIQHNECFGNYSLHFHSAPGIGIQRGAHPVVENNLVHHNDWGGISAHKGIDQGRVPCNRPTHPSIRNNESYLNGLANDGAHGAGISANDVGNTAYHVVIEGNTCRRNTMSGIGARNNSCVLIRKNICRHNAKSGIEINNCSTGALIKYNTCHDNSKAGVGASHSQGIILFHNTLSRNGKSGVGLDNCQEILVKHNEIFENNKAGLGIAASSINEILNNEIHHNQTVGIGFKGNSRVQLVGHNNIHHNQKPGIALLPGSKCIDIRNNIIDANGLGNAPNVLIRDTQTLLIMKNNTISNCQLPNIAIFGSETKVKLLWNSVSGSATASINIEGNAQVTLQNNVITDNPGTGVRGKNCQLWVYHNVLANNAHQLGCALRLENARVHIYNNIFYQNRMSISGTIQQLDDGHNCHFNSFCPPIYCSGPNNIKTDPQFVDPADRNFKLTPSSPCIDAGLHIEGVNDGYSGPAPDIGVYEQ